MKKTLLLLSIVVLIGCSKSKEVLKDVSKIKTERKILQTGIATWYGPGFQGRKTSSGERYDMYLFTAAHREMPLQSIIKVTNVKNGRFVIIRVNDRGPVNSNLILDLSKIAASNLDITRKGYGKIEIEVLGDSSNPLEKLFDVYRNMGNEIFTDIEI